MILIKLIFSFFSFCSIILVFIYFTALLITLEVYIESPSNNSLFWSLFYLVNIWIFTNFPPNW